MFEWVKGLFKKKKPDFDLSLLVVCKTLYSERTKGGKFAVGNKIWANTKREKNGRFARSK